METVWSGTFVVIKRRVECGTIDLLRAIYTESVDLVVSLRIVFNESSQPLAQAAQNL